MLPDSIPQSLEDGRTRDLMNLIEADFDIPSIAKRLAKINRFCGATRFPISVATHSVVVSYLAPLGLELTGLLHDIEESFGLNDMISPIKRLLPDYQALGHRIMAQLYTPFPCLKDRERIKPWDDRASAIEAFVHRGEFPDWAQLSGHSHPPTGVECLMIDAYYKCEISWQDSARLFVDRFHELHALHSD